MDLQRIQIKIAADAPPNLNLGPFVEIFGRWRADTDNPAEWVDLADYAHMSSGPGIVLIGHRCNISFDLTSPGPGILYFAKKGFEGSLPDRIATAFRDCFEMTKRLVAEPQFPAGVHLRAGEMEIRFADRLEAPNNDSTDKEIRPALQQVLDPLLSPKNYDLVRQMDPAQAYGFSIRSKTAIPLEELSDRLAHPVRR